MYRNAHELQLSHTAVSFFKIWYPTLGGTGVKELKKLETPSDRVVQKFTKASKLVSSFGRKMFNYIEKRMVEYTLGSLS
jgi:hypothetical protein